MRQLLILMNLYWIYLCIKVIEGLWLIISFSYRSEVMSKVIDFTDRNTCILFGDGAGAIVVEKERVLTFLQKQGEF